MIEREMIFENDGLRLAGVLRSPDHPSGRVPGVLLIHGSLEQDRDGNILHHPDGRPVFKKNFFLEISKRLCNAGFATFSWDQRGCGRSEGPSHGYNVFARARDAKAALDAFSSQVDVIDPDRIAVLGQSAGVYTACLLAREDSRPCAYVLQGGLYRDYEEMMAFNYARVANYAEKNRQNLEWAEENDIWGLAVGTHLAEITEAAKEGRRDCLVCHKDRSWWLGLDPLLYTHKYAPSTMFKYIDKPTLIVHGDCDLNVPVEDAFLIERDLKQKGNQNVERAIIYRADHSFQEAPTDRDLRLRERMSLECFRRPYREEYFQAVTVFLEKFFQQSEESFKGQNMSINYGSKIE